MWGVGIALLATMVAFMALAAWQGHGWPGRRASQCKCGQHRIWLNPPEPGGERDPYEVYACASCSDVVTALDGRPSRYAPCPVCRQFGLEVDARLVGLSAVGDPPPVQLHEQCQICGYEDVWSIPDVHNELPNNVIEFPRR